MESQEVKEKLAKLRSKIDELDKKIVKFLNERAQVVLTIKNLKEKGGLPIHDPKREEEILVKIKKLSNGPLSKKTLHEFYQKILEAMKAFE